LTSFVQSFVHSFIFMASLGGKDVEAQSTLLRTNNNKAPKCDLFVPDIGSGAGREEGQSFRPGSKRRKPLRPISKARQQSWGGHGLKVFRLH